MNAAIYVRVSTESQSGDDKTSLTSQVDACLDLAQRLNIFVQEQYIFREDVSGDFDVIKRPQLKRLFDMIRKGNFDFIFIYSADRLARKTGIGESFLDFFIQHNIRFCVAMHGREINLNNPMEYNMISGEFAMARYWKQMLLENMNRGKRSISANGKLVGEGYPLFGYEKSGNGNLIVNDDEALVIQDICTWFYCENLGVSEIIRRLRGTQTPYERSGKKDSRNPNTPAHVWRDSAIYRILRNSAYKGELITTRQGVDYIINIPAIIDEELWENIQKKLDSGKKISRRNAKHSYLMRNRMRCLNDSYTITTQPITRPLASGEMKTRFYYECQSFKKERPNAHQCLLPRYIPRDLVDEVIWGYVAELIKSPQVLIQRLKDSKKELDAHNNHIQERINHLYTLKQKQERKIDLLIEEYADIRSSDVKAMFQRIKQETIQLFDECNTEIEQLESQLRNNTLTDDFIESWSHFSKKVKNRIDNATFEERRKVIESLNIQADLTVEDSWVIAYLKVFRHTERLPIYVISKKQSSLSSKLSQTSFIPHSDAQYVLFRIPLYHITNTHYKHS